MKKIKNISHARIAEHMKQLKNAELPEHAGTAEHFRNEWKYLISTSEKELLELRMKHLLKKDPHASDGGYMIRSLYFDDYWNSAYEEKESGVLMRKKYRIRIYDYSDRSIKLDEKRNSAVTFTRKAHHLREKRWKKSWRGNMNFCCTVHILCAGSFILNVSVI